MTSNPPFADALQRLLNAAIELDRNLAARVRDLEGRCLAICPVSGPEGPTDGTFTVRCANGRVEVTAGGAELADAVATGTPTELLTLLVTGRGDGVDVSGDDLTFAEFRHCFKPQQPRLNPEFDRLFDRPPLDRMLGAAELGAATLRSAVEGLLSPTGSRPADLEEQLATARDRVSDLQDSARDVLARVLRFRP